MDTSINNLVTNESLKIFSSITLIDILNDKVSLFSCNNGVTEVESDSYENYLEKLKKVIHPDFLNDYFNVISFNNLKNNNQDIIWKSYMKLSDTLSYDNYVDAIKVLNENQVIITTFKYTPEAVVSESEPVNNTDDLSYAVADLIMNITTTFDNLENEDYEVVNVKKYITELTNDLLRKNQSVLKEYENKISVEVNKTYRSILIVDDDGLTRNIFKKVFEKEYNIIEAKNGAEAVELVEKNILQNNNESSENIVCMFLDLKMPVMDGFGVLNFLKEKRLLTRLPVVIISADDTKDTKEKIYGYDISDMIEKPFNYELIKKRVNTTVNMYAKSNLLDNLIKYQGRELKSILNSYVNAYLIDYKVVNDNVSKYLTIMLNNYKTKENNNLLDVNAIVKASKYYDLSINTIPRTYLNNINNLNEEEKKVVFNYPNMGENIIKYILSEESDSDVRYASNIIKMHNERYDGMGYPNSLKEDKIPMYVYLTNIAIEYASLKIKNINEEEIVKTINSKNGNKYHPTAIEIFNASLEEMKG